MVATPPVEFLWERGDPERALSERFGFADAAGVAGWVVDELGERWGVSVNRCDRVVVSGRNAMAWIEADDRRLIAKWSAAPERFAHLTDAAELVGWLDEQRLPVAAPIAALDGRRLIEGSVGGRRFLLGVLPVVDGALLDTADDRHLVDAGRMLAALHEALAATPLLLARRRPRFGEQIVHNDVRAANVLHDGHAITAVLDFEEVRHAPRAADLARSSVLLATRYRNWGPTTADQRATYLRAYEEQTATPLSPSERRAIGRETRRVLRSFGWS